MSGSITAKRVAIVGGGFTGSMLAVNLYRLGFRGETTVFDTAEAPGRGVGFGSSFRSHILNVPVKGMSAFPDSPGHFSSWMLDKGISHQPDDFVQRRIYGEYVEEVFRQETRGHGVKRVNARIKAAERRGAAWRCESSDGRVFEADVLALAVSNDSGGGLSISGERYVDDPWSSKARRHLESCGGLQSIACIGTGLTAVDVILAALENRFSGKFTLISRRGFLPRPHLSPEAHAGSQHGSAEKIDLPAPGCTLRELTAALRREAALRSDSWQEIFEHIRPTIAAYWKGFDAVDKERFLRHARPHWEVHRHRIPSETNRLLANLAEKGRLEIVRGRIDTPVNFDGKLTLNGRTREVEADLLFDCTGSTIDLRRHVPELLESLISFGAARSDRFQLGIETDPEGRVIDRNGEAQNDLWALGPLRRGLLWESTAVRELRQQAYEAAEAICRESHTAEAAPSTAATHR